MEIENFKKKENYFVYTLKKSYILYFLFLFIAVKGYSQDINKKNYHISASLFSELFSEPFASLRDSPLNLGGTVSFEMSKPRNGIYQFSHIFQLGYYYHKDFNQVGFISWKPKFEVSLFNMVNLHTVIGLGYAHSFPVRDSYVFKNDTYVKKTNYGHSHFMPSVGVGLGLNLEKFLNIPTEVFTRYEAFSLAPYALNGRVPITVNTMFHFGIKIKI